MFILFFGKKYKPPVIKKYFSQAKPEKIYEYIFIHNTNAIIIWLYEFRV